MRILHVDISKHRRQRHHSGLNRVSAALIRELGSWTGLEIRPVFWSAWRASYVEAGSGQAIGRGRSGDTFLSTEVFALRERPFCRRWMRRFRGSTGVVFYDAIPFFHPGTTWPRSVRRFPAWYRDLAAYGHVFFISGEAKEAAAAVGRQLGLPVPEGPVIPLGADYRASPPERLPVPEAVVLCTGILEPRKGQDLLLEASETLWQAGRSFRLVLLGRLNPHFGGPMAKRIQALQAAGRPVVHEEEAGDERLAFWHQRARLVVQPTRAEGYGLPVTEALWAGCPVLCSAQPSLQGLGEIDGLEVLPKLDAASLTAAMDRLLTGAPPAVSLAPHRLPTWRDTAQAILAEFALRIED